MQILEKRPPKAPKAMSLFRLVFPSGEIRMGHYYSAEQALGHLLTLLTKDKRILNHQQSFVRRCKIVMNEGNWNQQLDDFLLYYQEFGKPEEQFRLAYESFSFPFVAQLAKTLDDELSFWVVCARKDYNYFNYSALIEPDNECNV